MKYSEFRPNIASGDVLFWSHRSWKTWYDIQIQLIRFFTRSKYCHVGIAWVIGERVFVLEAVGSGIRIFPLRQALPFDIILRGGYWNPAMETEALSLIGAKYSKWEAIKAFFGRSSYKNEVWECAEYACYVLQLPVEDQTPANVADYLMETEGRPMHAVSRD